MDYVSAGAVKIIIFYISRSTRPLTIKCRTRYFKYFKIITNNDVLLTTTEKGYFSDSEEKTIVFYIRCVTLYLQLQLSVGGVTLGTLNNGNHREYVRVCLFTLEQEYFRAILYERLNYCVFMPHLIIFRILKYTFIYYYIMGNLVLITSTPTPQKTPTTNKTTKKQRKQNKL